MKTYLLSAAALPLLSLAAPLPVLAQTAPAEVKQLREAALQDDIAWDIAEGLTTEVGARPAGTPEEARARDWAVAKLKSLGFKNVHVEDYRMPVWVRGAETAEVVAPFPQKLFVTALGGSGATPAEGITAEVVRFETLDALRAAPEGSLKGKIAFISHEMKRTQDGSGYGYYGGARFVGPSVAATKGAAAVVIRSVGTDYHRNPHTGQTNFAEGVSPIPAGALSVPDAENLARMLERSDNVTLRLVLTSRTLENQPSGNVVAEVPGSDPKAGIIVIGGHLDSWDLATGAIDNAAGVAITAAAAKRIMEAGQPRRTIRVVWFGSEETGGFGSDAYFEAHKDENIVLVGESDFGAGKVWRVQTGLAEANKDLGDRLARALAPLGVTRGQGKANAGADLSEFANAGVAAIDLNQDGTLYFDYHHTPDDTLDKIDPEELRQNVAAWTTMLSITANAPETIERVSEKAPARQP
ncbi:M20/M25/M40 family metallo-hydrolase [Allosphingosinicella sp.]|uniref:M20/M25/M40 family metallo-hydrolase n=1 Tax=Allosphingosinicella sp. TaxID=2823234 RepID=UPI003D760D08